MAGDPSLTDVELQSEIDLVGALVLAAAQNDGPMSQERIDEVLGIVDVASPATASDSDDALRQGSADSPDGAGAVT